MSDVLRGVTDKALRAELKAAVKRGWTASITGGNHIRMLPPNGGSPVFTSLTPSSRRVVHHVRADLRRAERAS